MRTIRGSTRATTRRCPGRRRDDARDDDEGGGGGEREVGKQVLFLPGGTVGYPATPPD